LSHSLDKGRLRLEQRGLAAGVNRFVAVLCGQAHWSGGRADATRLIFLTRLGPTASRELRDLVLLTESSGGGLRMMCNVRAARLGGGFGEVGAPLVQAWVREASRCSSGAP
jgi:hypothetical protein